MQGWVLCCNEIWHDMNKFQKSVFIFNSIFWHRSFWVMCSLFHLYSWVWWLRRCYPRCWLLQRLHIILWGKLSLKKPICAWCDFTLSKNFRVCVFRHSHSCRKSRSFSFVANSRILVVVARVCSCEHNCQKCRNPFANSVVNVTVSLSYVLVRIFASACFQFSFYSIVLQSRNLFHVRVHNLCFKVHISVSFSCNAFFRRMLLLMLRR